MKDILTMNGIINVSLEQCIEMNVDAVKKFANESFEKLNCYETNILDKDDLFQIGMIELMGIFDSYDINKGFCFSTYLINSLRHKTIRLVRDTRRKKRINDLPHIYLDKVLDNKTENKEIISEDDMAFEYRKEKEGKLEEFLKTNLTKEELMMLTMDIKKQKRKTKDQDLQFVAESFEDSIGFKIADTKKELAQQMNISRPTLDYRLKNAFKRIKVLTSEYEKMER